MAHADVFGVITSSLWRIVLENCTGIYDWIMRVVAAILLIKWIIETWALCTLKRRLGKYMENRTAAGHENASAPPIYPAIPEHAV